MVYAAYHVIDGKIKRYVGQTVWSLERRRKRHECLALRCDSKTYFHNTLRKYGADSFTWEALTPPIQDKEERNAQEKRFIQLFRSHDPKYGYNLTLGGEGGIPTAATRQKLSEARKHRVITEETRQRTKRAMMGKKNALGVVPTEEARRNMGLAGKGRWKSEAHRRKIAMALMSNRNNPSGMRKNA